MKLKYITYEHFEGHQAFVIFDPITNHNDMSKDLRSIKFLGAGFVGFGDDRKAHCYGKSESMRIDSRGEKDSAVINMFIR